MQGNVVTAARWLGASLVLSSVVLVGGLHWVLSSHLGRVAEAPPRLKVVASATPGPGQRLPAEPARPGKSDAEDFEKGVQELLDRSESLRLSGDGPEGLWFLDQPSRLTPFRTHGGLDP